MSQDQFLAGETRTILRSKDPVEIWGRLNLLNKMAHWKIRTKSWPRVRALYESVITMIEEGEANWDSNFAHIEYMMMGNFTQDESTNPRSGRDNKKTKIWWCPDYNNEGCEKKAPHKHMVKGVSRMVHHNCAQCYNTKHERRNHSEKSDECPLREASD